MRETWRKSLWTFGIVLTLSLGTTAPFRAQAAAGRGAGPHGGSVEMTKHYRFEVVFTTGGLKVYPSGMDGKPLDATKLTAKATFYHPSTSTPWFDRPLSASAASPGQAPVSLERMINLSKVPTQGTKVAIELNGLPDRDEPTATFTVPFVLTQSPPSPVAAPRLLSVTFTRATAADQAAIRAQRVCRVSGESLGSMGMPIKATRGNQEIFLCCQGCVGKVRANPDAYFGAPR